MLCFFVVICSKINMKMNCEERILISLAVVEI